MNIPMSQEFDTNIANAEQNSRPARKNKTLAEIKEIQQSLVNNFGGDTEVVAGLKGLLILHCSHVQSTRSLQCDY